MNCHPGQFASGSRMMSASRSRNNLCYVSFPDERPFACICITGFSEVHHWEPPHSLIEGVTKKRICNYKRLFHSFVQLLFEEVKLCFAIHLICYTSRQHIDCTNCSLVNWYIEENTNIYQTKQRFNLRYLVPFLCEEESQYSAYRF